MKRVWIALVVIIICSCLYIFYDNNISNITPLSKYKPFDSELYIDTIKISSNLPKIDVATAFYPLASSIVQCIYDKNNYNNELSYSQTCNAISYYDYCRFGIVVCKRVRW